MDADTAKLFLECLGAKGSSMKSDQKWLRCSCPLAFWRHQNHTDSNPSFALSLEEGKSRFNCFSCLNGTLEELVQTLEMYVQQTPERKHLYQFAKAHQILDEQEDVLPVMPEWSEFGATEAKPFVEWPEAFLQSFVLAKNVKLACEYLHQPKDHLNEFGQKCRNSPPEITDAFDLRYDSQRGMVVFPYRNVYGKLAGMRGRSIVEKKHHDYTWNKINNAHQVWFNEPALDAEGWVVVCEGQMDCLRVREGGWQKVVANMTAKPTAAKLKKLLYSKGTILIPDNDVTGEASVERYKEFHAQHGQPLKILYLPDTVNDADDCSSAYLFDRINDLIL